MLNKILLVLSIIALVIGIALTVLPFGTIALIPVVFALILSVIVFLRQRKSVFVRILMLVIFVNLLTVIGKEVFVKDVVVVDQQFESEKQQSEQEAQKELEDLENLQ